jgi:hypothetical protein
MVNRRLLSLLRADDHLQQQDQQQAEAERRVARGRRDVGPRGAAVWDGITQPDSLNPWAADARVALADAAKGYHWSKAFELLAKHPEFVNSCRPGGKSPYAPLHQAAYGGAPRDVVQRLLGMGAWRTLQNVRGERPVDVAAKKGHAHLLAVLEPEYRRQVPLGILLKIQQHLHAVIRQRVDRLVLEHALRLPELEPLVELNEPKMWFEVPGMHGGFSFWLDAAGVEARLIAESWCRIERGSGQRHEITSAGSQLVAEGWV